MFTGDPKFASSPKKTNVDNFLITFQTTKANKIIYDLK